MHGWEAAPHLPRGIHFLLFLFFIFLFIKITHGQSPGMVDQIISLGFLMIQESQSPLLLKMSKNKIVT